MTAINRNVVILAITLLALVAIGAAFSAGATGSEALGRIPLILPIEFVIYFIAAMVTNPRATLAMAVGTGLVFLLIRAICALVGGIAVLAMGFGVEGAGLFTGWIDPVAVILQIAILLLSGPYLLAIIFPDLVGKKAAEELLGSGKGSSREALSSSALETSPTGGFIQAFSYEELSGVLRKGPGLAGSVIFNSDGLVVWSDLPVKADLDTLAARLYQQTLDSGRVVQAGSMGRARRLIIETREYLVVSTLLSPQFGLVLVFHGKTPIEEAFPRVGLLCRSTREFLQWKYSAIPLPQAPTSSDRVSLDF
ncbi:MAG: roadblock/LC7 domain-containing protein [Candidatus Sumerlaeia bacterium]|nr:roadblock/LC7 domain-containing protein [Candidatus Sumerlaeia bacterium]